MRGQVRLQHRRRSHELVHDNGTEMIQGFDVRIDPELFWLAWNIPGNATGVPSGLAAQSELPNGMRQATLGRTVGYRPKCSCGWVGRTVGNVRAARKDWRTHVGMTLP